MLFSERLRPVPPFRNPHLQTILSSSKIRTWKKNPMRQASRKMVLEVGNGIRLLGHYSPQNSQSAKGLVILLHGWEGSVDSTYILCTGRYLYQQRYAVFRLNFRDHGQSHHLNPGLFYATLLNEIFEGVDKAAGLMPNAPAFIVGFSLGGNFALRIARRCTQQPIQNLKHVISISPVLDPDKATDRIDSSTYILRYFLKKWRRSLQKKQALFPDRYDFSQMLKRRTIRSLTEALLERYSEYASAREYFSNYTLTNDALVDIQPPTTLLTAADDPIIPVEDFIQLKLNDVTRLVVQPYGGHNGFISGFSLNSWYERPLAELFDEITLRQ
jgi:predicted alpha/beta-fold hydrolase